MHRGIFYSTGTTNLQNTLSERYFRLNVFYPFFLSSLLDHLRRTTWRNTHHCIKHTCAHDGIDDPCDEVALGQNKPRQADAPFII